MILVILLLGFQVFVYGQGTANTFPIEPASYREAEDNELRLNTIYYEFLGNGLFFGSLSYERLLPMSPHSYLAPHIGVGIYEWPFLVGEMNLLLGGPKHFFETGIGYSTFAPEEGFGYASLRAGYRFMSPKGFILRLAPEYLLVKGFTDEGVVWGGLSLGYSF